MGESRKRRVQVVSRLITALAVSLATFLAHDAGSRVAASISISSVDATGRVALGDSHTCAITNDNKIWCWGDNNSYQLGIGASGNPPSDSAVPLQAIALGGGRIPQKISAGSVHTCVLATDGTVWCWGDNGMGQIGLVGSSFTQPTQVTLLGQASMVAAGGSSTCAVLVDNRVQCWGKNQYGQLGNNATSVSETSPQLVAHLPEWFTVAQIEVGVNHACAVSTVGGTWCWGYYIDGRLGSSQGSNAVVPTATSSLGGVAQMVSAGGAHSCVAMTTGAVQCFGKNNNGQLSQPITTTSNFTPTAVTLSGNATAVSVGFDYSCALMTAGGVECWGANGYGQLAIGTTSTRQANASTISGLSSSAVDVVAGSFHSCAVLDSGVVKCWGRNDVGQTGSNTGNLVETSAVAVGSLNVMPTTTTTSTSSSTSTDASTSTTIASLSQSSTTTVPSTSAAVNNETTTTTSATTTTTTTVGVAPMSIAIHALQLKRGARLSAAKIAAAVAMTIPKTSQGSMRITIVTGGKYCVFSGSAISAVRVGKCTIAVTLMPKKGKSVTRRTSITVR